MVLILPRGQDVSSWARRVAGQCREGVAVLTGVAPRPTAVHPTGATVDRTLLQLMDSFPVAVAYVVNHRLGILALLGSLHTAEYRR